MESRRKPATRVAKSRVKSATNTTSATTENLCLPNLEAFVEEGQITLGMLEPIGCVAIASDNHNSLAMLKRRQGEPLAELLLRLDAAIGEAVEKQIFTDEINTPPKPKRR